MPFLQLSKSFTEPGQGFPECLIHIVISEMLQLPFPGPWYSQEISMFWRGPFRKSAPGKDCQICAFSGPTTMIIGVPN